MSEQAEPSWTMPITETEFKSLCHMITRYLEAQNDRIEEGESSALDSINQKDLDIASLFYDKAFEAYELEYGNPEDSEPNLFGWKITMLGKAIQKAEELRDEKLDALLPDA